MRQHALQFWLMGLEFASILSYMDYFYETRYCSQFLADKIVTSQVSSFFISIPFLEAIFLPEENDLCCTQNKKGLYLWKIFCVSIAGQPNWYSILFLVQAPQQRFASRRTSTANLSVVRRTGRVFQIWIHLWSTYLRQTFIYPVFHITKNGVCALQLGSFLESEGSTRTKRCR